MTKKILVSYDFAQNEIQNAKIQNLASAPSTPVAGQVWYNTTSGKLEYRGAAANIDPTARGYHTGTQLAATISNFAATVQATTLNQFAAPTTAVAMNAQRLTGLAEPSAAQDAATKNYVDAAVNGTDWKTSVRAATTANIALTGNMQVIDGIGVGVGERVLVKNQTVPSENGLYNVASGAWSRTTDADQNVEVTAGLTVMVEEGTTQADSQWRLTTDGAVTLGTTALTFAQIGAGTSYSAGTGITITGNAVAIDTATVVRKFAATVGGATSIAVTHALNTTDVLVQAYLLATGELVECDIVRTNATTVTLGFAVAPAASSIRVSVQG